MPHSATIPTVSLETFAYFVWFGLFIQGAAYTWWLPERRPYLGLVLLTLSVGLAIAMARASG